MSADPAIAAALARISGQDRTLGCFTALAPDPAFGDGPLAGFTLGVKANIDVAGLATTAGVEARRHAIADADAPVVAALRAAGAAVLGHLNMHEAALGATTDNPFYGRTENPHRIGRTPGGSSGGSGAAVAAGLCRVALGTDTMGSVRIPAAYCGVYGLKPTNGLIGHDGLALLAAGLDTVGPLARSMADLAAVAAVMLPLGAARPVASFATLAEVEAAAMEPAVRAGYQRAVTALRALGVRHQPLPLAGLDLDAARMSGFYEAAREGGERFAADRAAGGISPDFARLIDIGRSAPPERVARADAARAAARAAVLAALEAVDVLLLPTAPQAAFEHGPAPSNQANFTALANLAGVPALALPAGFDDDRLPVSVQLFGRAGDEATILALGARLDQVLGGYAPPAGVA